MTNSGKTFLLVSFKNDEEDLKQEVLELALEYGIMPYSCPEDSNSLILESPSNSASSSFNERLLHNELAVEVKKFSR